MRRFRSSGAGWRPWVCKLHHGRCRRRRVDCGPRVGKGNLWRRRRQFIFVPTARIRRIFARRLAHLQFFGHDLLELRARGWCARCLRTRNSRRRASWCSSSLQFSISPGLYRTLLGDLRIDLKRTKPLRVRRQADVGKVSAKYWRQRESNFPTKCSRHCLCCFVGNPVSWREVTKENARVASCGHTLSNKSASCDAMADFLQPSIAVHHLSWHRLRLVRCHVSAHRPAVAYLGKVETLEQWCRTDQSDVIVPEHRVGDGTRTSRDTELVLEDCRKL